MFADKREAISHPNYNHKFRANHTFRAPALAGIVAMALILAGCEEKNAYVAPPPPKVTVTAPKQQAITRYLEFTGNTASVSTVDLVARVEGFLTAIDYEDGALVKKGTRLFLIQQDTYQAQLEQANAELAGAQAQLLNAQGEYNRQATLGKQDFSSQAVVDKAKAQMDSAAANVEAQKASVALAQINLGYTEVTAPFDGVVTRHLANIGQLVGHGDPTKLASIVEVNPIYVYFNVSEAQVLRIKDALAKQGKTLRNVGDIPVEIGLQNEQGYGHTGKLDYVSPDIDPTTGTLMARAVFTNDDSTLLPGLFVRVRVPTQQVPNALLVNDTSIGSDQQGSYVLVVGKDNVVEQRLVTTGPLEGQYRVIETGLTAGDQVVVGGIQRAVPGSKVDPAQAPSAAAATPPATTATP